MVDRLVKYTFVWVSVFLSQVSQFTAQAKQNH